MGQATGKLHNHVVKPKARFRDRAKEFMVSFFLSRRLPLFIAGLGFLLTLPSLTAGLLVDDYHHKILMQGSTSILRLLSSPFDMFRLIDGDPKHFHALHDYGFYPWWTYEKIKGAFWRPLSSFTHWLDYKLWPQWPVLMHVQSMAWYSVLVGLVTLFYRRIGEVTVPAGLAALLYAIDDAHAVPVSMLANRNAVLATVFGVLCLMSYDRQRKENWKPGILLGPLLLGASLLSAEAGIATVAYLLAYLFFIDNEPWLRRVRALLPYLLVVVVWRMVWTGLGYGVANVGLYIDPIQAPFRFGRALIDRLPMLFLSQWGWPPADVSLVLGPDKRHLFWILACVFLLSVFFIGLPLLRRDRIARFWAFGALLSIIPICTTFPSERLLLFVGIGAMGFISQFLVVVFRKNDGNAKWGYPAVGLGVFFIFVHLIIATPTLLVHSAWPVGPKWVMGQFYIQTPFDQRIETQDLILVNPPEAVFALNSLLLWESEHQPLPRHLRVLASSRLRPVTVSRLDDRTLIIRPEKGFIAGDMDRLFRAEDHLLSLGEQVKLTGVFITINELNADHRPATAVFRFSVPLEDSSLRWLQWKDGKFIPFVPPRIGERVILHPGRLSLFPW